MEESAAADFASAAKGVSLGFRILRGLIDGVLAGLTEPPTANHQNCRDNDNGDNRNNHIRIHDSSLKSATDTLHLPFRMSVSVESDKHKPIYVSRLTVSAETVNEPSKSDVQMTDSGETDK